MLRVANVNFYHERLLDFERFAVAGEVFYTIEGDSAPTSQQDEEARIATLAYALKKPGSPEDAAEFMRRLNAICEEGDACYRWGLSKALRSATPTWYRLLFITR